MSRAEGSTTDSRSAAARLWSPTRTAVFVVGFLGLAVLYTEIAPDRDVYIGATALLAASGAVALNVLTGSAGLVSIGNAAYLGIGAYSAVILAPNAPFLVVLLVGGVTSAVVGLLIGIPSLRLRGLYLVFSTLALQELANFAFQKYDQANNAISGNIVPAAHLGPIEIASNSSWMITAAIFLVLVVITIRPVLAGRPGRAWAAISSNEVSAAIMGINVTRAKLSAFVYSSFVIGVQGALTAYFIQNVGVDYFSLSLAISYAAMILIGGLGSVGGAIAGAILVTALPYFTTYIGGQLGGSQTSFLQQNIAQIDQLIYGLLIMAFMFWQPGGLAEFGHMAARLGGSSARWLSDTAAKRRPPRSGAIGQGTERPERVDLVK